MEMCRCARRARWRHAVERGEDGGAGVQPRADVADRDADLGSGVWRAGDADRPGFALEEEVVGFLSR
ncbi:MAG: hypothetical protein U0232_13940 [Thermomicrobiales bacterium]